MKGTDELKLVLIPKIVYVILTFGSGRIPQSYGRSNINEIYILGYLALLFILSLCVL